MAQTKKEPMPRNGARHAATRKSRGVRPRTGLTKTGNEPLLEVSVQSEGPEQFRDAQQQIAEITRKAQQAHEQLVEVVRQAKEARRELEGLREVVRAPRPPAAEETPKRSGRKGREHSEPSTARRAEPRNRLGVTVGSGVVVADVLPDTPAAQAGVTRGDVIEVVNGSPIVSATELRDAVHKTDADTDVTLRIFRAGKPREVKVRLGAEKPEAKGNSGQNRFGVTVGPGVVVAEVLPHTLAVKAGLQRGDVIDSVNGTPVLSGEQLRDVVQQLSARAAVVLHITRAGDAKEIKVRLNGDGSR